MNFDDFAIPTVERNSYRINFWFMTKREAVNRVKNIDLSKKSGQL